MMKVAVRVKSKRAMEARNDRTMLRLVAKPFRMLSEYLMTIAVTSPPSTWTATVAHAQGPKLRNKVENQSDAVASNPDPAFCACDIRTGAIAGRREKRES